MNPLPLRVRFQPGEPADSIVHRLATRWGMSRTAFERFVGLDASRVRQGAHAAEVAALAGFDPDPVRHATPCRDVRSRQMRVGAAWTDLSDVATHEQRFCPACLAEDRRSAEHEGRPPALAAWSRMEWCVRSIATCIEHRVVLLATCPACAASTSRDNPALDLCRCGAGLHVASAEEFDSEVDRILLFSTRGREPNWFAGGGLHQVSSHLTRLGSLGVGWSERRPRTDGRAALQVREEGLRLLLAGEAALTERLDALTAEAQPGASGRLGLTSAYGWVWSAWLGVPTSNPLDLALRRRVRAHAVAAGIDAAGAEGGLTLEGACALLGAGHDRTRRLVHGAGLLSGRELPGVAMSIDAEALKGLASDLDGLLDAAASAAELGIARTGFRALVRAGHVRCDERARALGAGILYARSSLERLVDGLSIDTPRLERGPSRCRPLPIACRDASVPLPTVIEALLGGTLRAVARTPAIGLGGIWVSVHEMRGLASRAGGSIRSAARRLGLHYEAARWLAAEGVLGSRSGLVEEEAVERFAASFRTSAQAGHQIGVSARAASAKLKNAGQVPAFGPPACRQEIWSTAALARAGWDRGKVM